MLFMRNEESEGYEQISLKSGEEIGQENIKRGICEMDKKSN